MHVLYGHLTGQMGWYSFVVFHFFSGMP